MPTFGKGCSVSAAATSGMTVPANSYVVATYLNGSTGQNVLPVIVYYGPGQTVPATIPSGTIATMTFSGGVVFTNS